MAEFSITGVRVGKCRPLGMRGVLSGIDKRCVSGPVLARITGLVGDEQGDPSHHGGPDKALHAYPAPHYAAWMHALPDRAARFQPGGFGENLVIAGATEADLCLFDRFRLGGAEVEISQTRQPCWKLNQRFDVPDMARRVQESGCTGWYFRVTREGLITRGDRAELIARPHPDWTLSRVWQLLYRDTLDHDALAAFAALPGLPERWQRMAGTRITRMTVEDWAPRLEMPP